MHKNGEYVDSDCMNACCGFNISYSVAVYTHVDCGVSFWIEICEDSYKIKSHKFENNYELFTEIINTKKIILSQRLYPCENFHIYCEKKFDHGSYFLLIFKLSDMNI